MRPAYRFISRRIGIILAISRTRFASGHLVQKLEQSLEKEYPADKIRSLLEPFEELERDHDFWTHTLAGIAVFGAPEREGVWSMARSGS